MATVLYYNKTKYKLNLFNLFNKNILSNNKD